jgi:hypothetical protein
VVISVWYKINPKTTKFTMEIGELAIWKAELTTQVIDHTLKGHYLNCKHENRQLFGGIMASLSETVQKIISDSSHAEDLANEVQISLPERYKRFLIRFIEKYESKDPKKIQYTLYALELVLAGLGASLGFLLIYIELEKVAQLAIWISYIIIYVLVGFTIKIIPNDSYEYYLEASKIRLVNLAERLAAQVALYNLIDRTKADDDLTTIAAISEKVFDLNQLDEATKKQILACQNKAKTFTDPRETNVVIPPPLIDEDSAEKLQDIVRQIVELCGNLFAGRDYNAKLYLRANKKLGNDDIELLTPFAKFPFTGPGVRGTYGSSWLKARGNPSKAWECIEKGQTVHATTKNFGTYTAYYSASLSICLPGRIGVLAITSNQENAFENKYDEWVIKSLSVPTKHLVLGILEISEKNQL